MRRERRAARRPRRSKAVAAAAVERAGADCAAAPVARRPPPRNRGCRPSRARAPRPADSLAGLAAELSTRLSPPEARRARAEPRAERAPRSPPPAEPPPPAQADHNLAEMAQQLEAALRRAPVPESRPPVTDPLAARAGQAGAGARFQAARRTQIRTAREPKIDTKDRAEDRAASSSPRPSPSSRRAGQGAARQSRTGDGQLARPSVRKDVTGIVRPPRPSCDGGGRSSRADRSGGDACRRAGHQHQFRPRQRADRARDPDDRAAHGAVAGAVDPGDDDVVHPHRGGAVAAAHRARHRHRAAQRGDRLARAVPHRLRDGAGAAERLRHRRAAADRQRDHRRAGVRARRGAVARLHGEERPREGPQAVRRHGEGSRSRPSPRTCRCACWCRPS